MSPGVSFLLLSGIFVAVAALERVPAFQFRSARLFRPFLATDAAWYLVATTAGLISMFVLRPQLSKLALPATANLIERLGVVPRVVLAVVAYDFVAFAVHVGIHRSDTLWSVHKVHHSTLQLDWLATTRTHLFEHLLRNVPAQGALFALGMSAQTVAICTLVYAAFALHGHSNLHIGGRWLELVFVTPRLHRLHHLPATTQNNFGTVFTLWDRLLGRLVVRDAAPEERTGVPGEIDEYPQKFVVALRQPVKEGRARRARRRPATSVRIGDAPRDMRPDSKRMSIQFEDESQPVVDGDEFLVGDTSDELTEPFGCNGGGLLDQDLGRLIINCDRRTKDTWLRRT